MTDEEAVEFERETLQTTYESLGRLAAAHEMDTSDYLRQVAVTLKDFDSSLDEHGHKQLVTA